MEEKNARRSEEDKTKKMEEENGRMPEPVEDEKRRIVKKTQEEVNKYKQKQQGGLLTTKTTPNSKKQHRQTTSQANKQQHPRANRNPINSITDLKDFLARKKREREEKLSLSLGSTFLEKLENRNSPSKTTQLVGMFPSPTTKLEDDSERLAMKQCATDSCNAVNNKGI